jgi:hypothetical protein
LKAISDFDALQAECSRFFLGTTGNNRESLDGKMSIFVSGETQLYQTSLHHFKSRVAMSKQDLETKPETNTHAQMPEVQICPITVHSIKEDSS